MQSVQAARDEPAEGRAAVSHISAHSHKDSQTPRPTASQYRSEQSAGSCKWQRLEVACVQNKLAEAHRAETQRVSPGTVKEEKKRRVRIKGTKKETLSQDSCHLAV